MTRSLAHTLRALRKGFSGALLLLFSAGLLSCGGGPEVASSTGHYLFVSNSNGIYAFSIQTNNTLSPVSKTAEQTVGSGSNTITGMVYVATPGGINAPTVYAIDGTASLYALPANGSGLGTPSSVSLSACSPSISSIDAVTASSGGNYLLVAYTSSSSSYLAAVPLTGRSTTGTTCLTSSGFSSSPAPSEISIDCAVSAGSPCNGVVTFQNATSPPEIFTWTKGSAPSAPTNLMSSSVSSSEFNLFSLSTGYFYLFSPSKKNAYSVTGNTPAATPASTQTIPSNQGDSPCLDTLANQIYLPITNGSIYQMGIQTNGSIGGAGQLWSLGNTPSLPSIGTCAVED